MKNIIFILIMSLCQYAGAAGNEGGGGGNVVRCVDNSGKINLKLLDYYEAQTLRRIFYDLGPASLSVDEKVALAISRIEPRHKQRAASYQKWANSFYNEALFLEDVSVVSSEDSFHKIQKQGCDVRQIVRQNSKPGKFREDKRYIVDKDYWSLLDADNKAGLILHEIIYREALEAGAKNSEEVRYFNSYVTADKLKDFVTTKEYMQFINQSISFIKGADFNGFVLSTAQTNNDLYYSNGNPKEFELENNSTFSLFGTLMSLEKSKYAYGAVRFYQNGQIEKVEVRLLGGSENKPENFRISLIVNGNAVEFGAGISEYRFRMNNSQMIPFDTFNIDFYENGLIKRGHLSKAQAIQDQLGKWHKLDGGHNVHFDINGKATEWDCGFEDIVVRRRTCNL